MLTPCWCLCWCWGCTGADNARVRLSRSQTQINSRSRDMWSALDELKSLLRQHRGSKGVMSLLGLCSSSLPMQQLGGGHIWDTLQAAPWSHPTLLITQHSSFIPWWQEAAGTSTARANRTFAFPIPGLPVSLRCSFWDFFPPSCTAPLLFFSF